MEPGISLLYAEDDPQARTLLEKLLYRKFPGLAVYVAADGEEGLALFNEHRPQLILTDIVMPVMDGIEMIRRIRELAPESYVIAVTAYSDADFCRKGSALRLNRCINKPVDFKALMQILGEAIESLSRKPLLQP